MLKICLLQFAIEGRLLQFNVLKMEILKLEIILLTTGKKVRYPIAKPLNFKFFTQVFQLFSLILRVSGGRKRICFSFYELSNYFVSLLILLKIFLHQGSVLDQLYNPAAN